MSETVNFVLKTTDINIDNTPSLYYNTTFSNSIGTIAKNRTSITWNNINLKSMLGEMYDRYERFNISFNFMCGSRCGSVQEPSSDTRTFYVKMRGLNFTSSYNQKTGNNDNSIILTSLRIPQNIFTAWDLANITTTNFTFIKQETVNINIDLINVFNDSYYVLIGGINTMIGHFAIGLTITGCEDYKNIQKSENKNVDLELRKIF